MDYSKIIRKIFMIAITKYLLKVSITMLWYKWKNLTFPFFKIPIEIRHLNLKIVFFAKEVGGITVHLKIESKQTSEYWFLWCLILFIFTSSLSRLVNIKQQCKKGILLMLKSGSKHVLQDLRNLYPSSFFALWTFVAKLHFHFRLTAY